MQPFAPIAGISLEQYAELCAILAPYEGNAAPFAELLHQKGVSLDNWTAARTGWTNQLEDPSVAATLAMKFVPAYQAALDRAHGPAPQLSFDEYIALSAEVQHVGLVATLGRLRLARYRFDQIAFCWAVAFSREPQQFVAYVCLLHVEIARLARGEPARSIPALGEGASAKAGLPDAHRPVDGATPAAAPVAAAPVAVVAPAPIAAHPVSHTPAQAQPAKSLEQEASEAANAVGSALKSGFNKLGGALDAFGRSLNKRSVGSHVLVAWSDGNKYAGVVAEVGQGQYLVTMTDGRQVWIPEAYVSSAG